jgi:hypothetical protein
MDNVVNINNEEIGFNEKMLRAKDLSKIFVGLVQSTFDNWAKQGLVTQYRIGGSIFYKLSEVQSLIENSKVS